MYISLVNITWGGGTHGCTGRLSGQHHCVDRGATQRQWGKEAARVD